MVMVDLLIPILNASRQVVVVTLQPSLCVLTHIAHCPHLVLIITTSPVRTVLSQLVSAATVDLLGTLSTHGPSLRRTIEEQSANDG
jgi:hypothetical protein